MDWIRAGALHRDDCSERHGTVRTHSPLHSFSYISPHWPKHFPPWWQNKMAPYTISCSISMGLRACNVAGTLNLKVIYVDTLMQQNKCAIPMMTPCPVNWQVVGILSHFPANKLLHHWIHHLYWYSGTPCTYIVAIILTWQPKNCPVASMAIDTTLSRPWRITDPTFVHDRILWITGR